MSNVEKCESLVCEITCAALGTGQANEREQVQNGVQQNVDIKQQSASVGFFEEIADRSRETCSKSGAFRETYSGYFW